MSAFECFPTVPKCCLCIDLKIGCVIIGILTLLGAGGVASLGLECATKDTLGQFVHYFIQVNRVMQVLLIIAALIFLIGILLDKGITAEIFMWTLLIFLILIIINFVVTMLGLFLGKCKTSFFNDRNSVVSASVIIHAIPLILFAYFIMVVKSYRYEMGS